MGLGSGYKSIKDGDDDLIFDPESSKYEVGENKHKFGAMAKELEGKVLTFKQVYQKDKWFVNQLLQRYWEGILPRSMHAFARYAEGRKDAAAEKGAQPWAADSDDDWDLEDGS